MSQNDTIELRGFDESEKPGAKKKLSPSRVKRAKEWSKKKNEPQQGPVEEKDEPKGPAGRSTPTAHTGKEIEQPTKSAEPVPTTSETENKSGESGTTNDQSFNFDDILKCDTFPGLLTVSGKLTLGSSILMFFFLQNGVGGDGDNMKSRFSRWFKQESPEKAESRRPSLHDDHHIIKDLLNDIGETSVSIPGDSEAYFAPISPAGNTSGVIGGKRGGGAQSQPINIMEMLQRGKHQGDNAAVKQPPRKLSRWYLLKNRG